MGLNDLVNKAKDLAGDLTEKATEVGGKAGESLKDLAEDVGAKAKVVAETVTEEAGKMKDIAAGEGSISDKAKAAVDHLKDVKDGHGGPDTPAQ
ncbi:MAG: hypothetical protein U0Y82_15120 [Thermoleophilia bacterium]